jgi:hypothetical protein
MKNKTVIVALLTREMYWRVDKRHGEYRAEHEQAGGWNTNPVMMKAKLKLRHILCIIQCSLNSIMTVEYIM